MKKVVEFNKNKFANIVNAEFVFSDVVTFYVIWEKGKPTKGALEVDGYSLVPLKELPLEIQGEAGTDMYIDGDGVITEITHQRSCFAEVRAQQYHTPHRQLLLRWIQYEKRGPEEFGEVKLQTDKNEISRLFVETKEDEWCEIAFSSIKERYATKFYDEEGKGSAHLTLSELSNNLKKGEGRVLDLAREFGKNGWHFFGIMKGKVDWVVLEPVESVIKEMEKGDEEAKVKIMRMVGDIAELIFEKKECG